MVGAISGAFHGVEAFPADYLTTLDRMNHFDLAELASKCRVATSPCRDGKTSPAGEDVRCAACRLIKRALLRFISNYFYHLSADPKMDPFRL